MGEKIVVGPITKALRTDVTPFNIDNDNFPVITNAYQWRGRVKRKRGTSSLTRLTRFFNSTISSYNSGSTTITLGNDGSGNGTGNLLTGFITLESNANIVIGNVTINDTSNGATYTDTPANGTLLKNGLADPGSTINYSTGAIVIAGRSGDVINATFTYNPALPVMGLEDLSLNNNTSPSNVSFDTVYAYQIQTNHPYNSYSVSFYKNPQSGTYTGYTQKTNWTPTTWNSQNYQQVYTVNYQGALWATNGVTTPFSINNIGMQYKTITNITNVVAGPPATAKLTINGHGLVVGDFLFINEVGGVTGINFQTGYVITVNDANNVTVEFPNAQLGGAYSANGIAQYLTNRSDTTKDCLRWYDGDPTNGNITSPTFVPGNGWVNFAPPVSFGSYSISDLPPAQYYLIGAKIIFPFKDRLLFIGPVVQSSAAGSQVYLQDTIIYSQVGTPYYTASFKYDASAPADPTLASIVFNPILTPTNQTAAAPAYFADQTGFGGFVQNGVGQAINSVSPNRDVLMLGLQTLQSKLIYSGNDIVPFIFFTVNSELGTSSTFSAINMDNGVLTIGDRGIIMSNQTEALRIDLDIPDQVFEMQRTNQGSFRITAIRDFINEWVYFTYPTNTNNYSFPTQTLLYNYRDASWGIFNECYTTYGLFRKTTGLTWATLPANLTWNSWNTPWNSGSSNLLEPDVIAGNTQGFVIVRDDSETNEAPSLYIQSFSGNQITSPNHCLNNGDYIVITNCIGTIGAQVNQKTFSVYNVTTNTFNISPSIGTGTYSGGGLITRIYVPYIQTKQFPAAWSLARKVRIGPQQYLLTTTQFGQITLLIFLSQNAAAPYNLGPVVPDIGSLNNALIYSTVLYTCPESTNIGLTAANVNLQMPTASDQAQIWHRMNTSLIGDTVQVGFTISDAQIRSLTNVGNAFAITGATQAYPCVLTCTGNFPANSLITISGVTGMTQLNGNTYAVISSTSSSVTINVDSSAFTAYSSGGTATQVANQNQFSEIELHGFILDVNPSQMLA